MFLLLSGLLLSGTSLAAMPSSFGTWNVLSSGDPWVGCVKIGTAPWCRVEIEVKAPISKVDEVLHDFDSYARKTFASISKLTVVAPDTVRIVLDMPFPLSDRDYVVAFRRTTEGSDVIYRFDPFVSPAAPPQDGVIRLPDVAGEWRLTPTATGTKVRYTWQADLGGDVPEWAFDRAHLEQGQEVAKGVRGAVE